MLSKVLLPDPEGPMMANLSLAHGHTPASAFGYAFFGLTHVAALQDYGGAYELGRLAMSLAEKIADPSQVCRTSHVFCASDTSFA